MIERRKYQDLAADLATQWKCPVEVIPVVVGDLGLIGKLRRQLGRAKIFTADQMENLIGRAQRESICGSIQILKRHLATKDRL